MEENLEIPQSGPSIRLATERLVLRPPKIEDHDFLIQVYKNPAVMEHINFQGRPDSSEQAEARFRRLLHHWEEHAYGMFFLERKDTGRPVGYCGLRLLSPDDNPELGYIIDQPHWGLGLATEAGRQAVRFARDQMHLPGLIALTSPENEASQNILFKLGFHRNPGRDGQYHGDDTYFFELSFSQVSQRTGRGNPAG